MVCWLIADRNLTWPGPNGHLTPVRKIFGLPKPRFLSLRQFIFSYVFSGRTRRQLGPVAAAISNLIRAFDSPTGVGLQVRF